MPTLAQIANKIRDKAVVKAPKRKTRLGDSPKPGNLKRMLAQYNRPAGMVKENGKPGEKNYSFEFSLDVSPPGAEYGKYWNDPNVSSTVRNQKTGNDASINFADKAMNDEEITKMIDEYIGQISDAIVSKISEEIDKL